MRPTIFVLASMLLLVAACKQDSGENSAETKPQSTEEYTLAIIKEVQKVILSTGQQLREYPPERLEVPTEEGSGATILELWTEEGNPVRLTVSEPGNSGLTEFYFANGELFYAARPGAGFIFIDNQLKYWLDEDWKPAKAPEQERKKLEKQLPEKAAQYLRLFSDETKQAPPSQ